MQKLLKKKNKIEENLEVMETKTEKSVEKEKDEEMDEPDEVSENEEQENEPAGELVEKGAENDEEGPPVKKGKIESKENKEEKEARPPTEEEIFRKKIVKLGEVIRRSNCQKPILEKTLDNLKDLLKGKYDKHVYNHAVSRVVEWMIKLSGPELTKSITLELRKDLNNMARQKYSRHVVLCLIGKADKETFDILHKELSQEIVKLLLLGTSSSVVAEIYNKSSKVQKRAMKQSFFGRSFKIFKTNEINTLKDVSKQGQTEKGSIFSEVYDNLIKVVEKNGIKSEVTVQVLQEFLESVEPNLKKHEPFLKVLQKNFVELEQYDVGAWLASYCIWNSSAKERKQIMKATKAKPDLAASAVGYEMLITIMDCIDDTTLINKIVLQPLLEDCVNLCSNKNGVKVVGFAVKPRSTQFLHPQQIKFLQQGDANQHSKKEIGLRQKEIKDFAVPLIAGKIKGNLSPWITNAQRFLFLKNLMDEVEYKEVVEVMTEFVSLLANPDHKEMVEHEGSKTEMPVIEVPFAQKLAMHMVKEEKGKYAKDSSYTPVFCALLVPEIKKTPEFWLDCKRGRLTFLCMMETEIPSVTGEVREFLKPHLNKIKGEGETCKIAKDLYTILAGTDSKVALANKIPESKVEVKTPESKPTRMSTRSSKRNKN
ncbi:pumilio homolog 3 [Neocloeon triangulifer]|uniref:pumilio homolog 3 n=1 Tax=Neocloeon triangulifer TaxID=2078957 RepID=UPI00286F8BB8|nr:pumilio homolog 3 [Neocloeon triangulifer]